MSSSIAHEAIIGILKSETFLKDILYILIPFVKSKDIILRKRNSVYFNILMKQAFEDKGN